MGGRKFRRSGRVGSRAGARRPRLHHRPPTWPHARARVSQRAEHGGRSDDSPAGGTEPRAGPARSGVRTSRTRARQTKHTNPAPFTKTGLVSFRRSPVPNGIVHHMRCSCTHMYIHTYEYIHYLQLPSFHSVLMVLMWTAACSIICVMCHHFYALIPFIYNFYNL